MREVVRAVSIASLPQPSEWVEGIINLRGTIVPVFSLRALLSFPAREIELTDHLIVIEQDARLIALHVDHAVDLVNLVETQCEAVQAMQNLAPLVLFEAKLPGGIIHVLDPKKFGLGIALGEAENRDVHVLEGADGQR